MKKFVTIVVIVVIVLIIFFMLGPFYIVEEGEQAVVLRFGKIIETAEEAGLKIKTPLVDNVVKFPKKILAWDGDPQRVPTKENQFIWIDTTARWRITEPKLFYSSVITINQAYSRLDDVIDSSVRTIIAENELREAVRNSNIINEIERKAIPQEPKEIEGEGLDELTELTKTQTKQEPIEKGRVELSNNTLKAARQITPQYGIKLIDVIVRQIRYSDDLTESVYNRMIKERNQIAQAFRSYGEGKKKEWLGKLENEKKSVLSSAYERAETIRGEADAEATEIYSKAYSKDLDFFEYWRAIESYRSVLPKFNKTLTTDMDYFKYLYNKFGSE